MLLVARMVDMWMNFYLKSNGIQAKICNRHNYNESNIHKNDHSGREFQPTKVEENEFQLTSNIFLLPN
jgi:hypothetical protein